MTAKKGPEAPPVAPVPETPPPAVPAAPAAPAAPQTVPETPAVPPPSPAESAAAKGFEDKVMTVLNSHEARIRDLEKIKTALEAVGQKFGGKGSILDGLI